MHPAIVELQKRGLINQSTDIEVLSKLLSSGSAVYCGFDPTADSLHVGSLLPLTVLNVLKSYGVPVIALVGGATGAIGDPSFKSTERQMMGMATIIKNVQGIETIIKNVLGDDVKIVNNESWSRDINMIEFLRTYGKCFTVNNMINKESVRSRIERPDQGISFTEFAYPILQGMDFEHLFEGHNCNIQIGGSDQWGNMIAGIDVIHKMHGNEAECGVITLPLLTKDDGTKFGKSESGTVWLSADKTSPYEYYQFWLNVSDTEMLKLYQYFQPLSFSVEEISREMQVNPVIVKKQFAMAMTAAMHGYGNMVSAAHISEFLFGNHEALSTSEIEMMISSGFTVAKSDTSVELVSLLVDTDLAPSRKMAREFIDNGAVKVNGRKVNEFYDTKKLVFTEDTGIIDEKYFILQRGRNNFVIIENLRRYV